MSLLPESCWKQGEKTVLSQLLLLDTALVPALARKLLEKAKTGARS